MESDPDPTALPRRRLLVVSYYYRPAQSVGGNRWTAMVAYLREWGHDVTVLTTSAFGELGDDHDAGIVRAHDLAADGTLRRVLRRPPVATARERTALESPGLAGIAQELVPDPTVLSWLPFALPIARSLVKQRSIDAIITTSPVPSACLVGLLGRRDAAWVADFRDGWTYEPPRAPFRTRIQRTADLRLERSVARKADAVIGTSEPIATDLRQRYDVPTTHIPNAWDPRLESLVSAATHPALEPNTVSIVYTGGLSGAWGRQPTGLFDALRAFRASDPGVASRLRFVIAGALGPGDAAGFADLDGLVRHVGYLSRPSSLALQRSADALLVLTSDHRSETTGKLLEYLAARRPIIALADGNEAARIVRETGTGTVVAPSDVRGIVNALRSVVDGSLTAAYAPSDLDPYRYPTPAAQAERVIQAAIAARR